jgi:hypothetical protein
MSSLTYTKTVHHHINIQCDGCRMHPLLGERHKCKVCPGMLVFIHILIKDFDLCTKCLQQGIHKHEFEINNSVRVEDPTTKFVPLVYIIYSYMIYNSDFCIYRGNSIQEYRFHEDEADLRKQGEASNRFRFDGNIG